MTTRTYGLTLALTAAITAGSLFAATRLFMKDQRPSQEDQAVQDKTSIFMGRITRIEPPLIFAESTSPSAPRKTYEIMIGPRTALIQLKPWMPGEKESAQKAYQETVRKQNPSSGDLIPPPPMEMKAVPLPAEALTTGLPIGVRADSIIDPAKPIIAKVIRPLTEKEIETGQVAVTFPLY